MSSRKMQTGNWLLLIAVFTTVSLTAQEPHDQSTDAPLTAAQVVKNLEEKNRERAAGLRQFQGKRIYRMQYRGFPSNRDAEMVVNITYQAPDTKQFTVVSQTGSKFVIDHVFKKLLDSEQEASTEKYRQRTALTSANYDFTLAAYENTPEGARYVLNTIPKSEDKFLYRGKIWVDGTDFAVIKIEASPAKNPSFWIKKTEIEHTYIKVDGFWLPATNRSETNVRLGGHAVLSIEYMDYKINNAVPHAGTAGSGTAGLQVLQCRQ